MKYFVYCLMKEDQVVYIGSSSKLLNRIKKHSTDKDFDKVTYCELPDKQTMLEFEKFSINKVRPPLNRSIPVPKMTEKPEGLRWRKANLSFLMYDKVDIFYDIQCDAAWDYAIMVFDELGIHGICPHDHDLTFIMVGDKVAAVFDGSGLDMYDLAKERGIISYDDYITNAYKRAGKIMMGEYEWSLKQFD